MTDREKAIVMAYTGICMLQGEKINKYYEYLAELYGRPVYTHEIAILDIAEKSKADFVRLCQEEQQEIVRCKDCTFYRSDGCFFSTAEIEEDGFCSWAERRTDE